MGSPERHPVQATSLFPSYFCIQVIKSGLSKLEVSAEAQMKLDLY